MTVFWIIVSIGLVIFLYSKFKREVQLSAYDENRTLIEKWVNSKNGKFESFRFNIYDNDILTVNKGSTIFVGMFDRDDGENVGFYIEINNGDVVLDKLYFPSGITSWHSTRAREALHHGVTLFELLNLAETKHHDEFPEWKNKK